MFLLNLSPGICDAGPVASGAILNPFESSQSAASIDDIVITAELDSRSSTPHDCTTEHAAYVELARVLATSPGTLLQRLAELAVELCAAGTAGVSLLDPGTREGDGTFRWIALAGVYAMRLGDTVPERFSPCGDCLRRRSVQLYARPGRAFPELSALSPPIIECLIVPVEAANGPRGTLWIMTHSDSAPGFTRHDADILIGLAEVTAAALALHAARSAAEAALHAAEARLAAVTHDLVASLTPTLGWTDVLLSGRATPAHTARAIIGIRTGMQRQARLIEALIDTTSTPHT